MSNQKSEKPIERNTTANILSLDTAHNIPKKIEVETPKPKPIFETLVMKNQERFRITSDCCFANIQKIFRKDEVKGEQFIGLFAESTLTTQMRNTINEHRKYYTLEKTMRTLFNMVPVPKPTPEEIENQTEMKWLQYKLLHDSNVFQP